jgi:hypothetical protein
MITHGIISTLYTVFGPASSQMQSPVRLCMLYPSMREGGRFAIIKHGEVATATQSVKLEDLKLKPLVFKNFQKIMGKWEQYPNVSANLTIFQASHMYCFHSLMAT